MPEKLKLVVQMICRNEEKRYLKKILASVSEYADKIVVIDDASTDRTPEICASFPKVILKQLRGKPLWPVDESKLRTKLWEMVRKLKPQWVLTQDSDELFDKSFKKRLPELLNSKWDWIAFRLCDMWNENHYRIDGYWSPIFRRLFRFRDEPFGIRGQIHCASIPKYALESNNGTCCIDVRVKHLSWMTEEDRRQKMKLYSKIPMTGINAEHLKSVSSPPRLKKWTEKIIYPKIKICAPFKDDEWCLPEFLEGIVNLNYPKDRLSLYFLENDSQDKTLEKLKKWAKQWRSEYRRIEVTSMQFRVKGQEHVWPEQTLENMTFMRNGFLKNIGDNDYIFNLDSDVVLQPQTLKQLALSDRDIICEIFWARWDRVDDRLMPNVWPYGGYEGVTEDFMAAMETKGIKPVGGLGASNLISKYAIEKGCSFDAVSNLPLIMRGEDRHFCIRAKVLGFELWADTFFPAIHREKMDFDLQKKLGAMKKKRLPEHRISLVMIAHDEEYFLENFLYRMSELFDEIIIVDTGSKDGSKEVARRYTDKVYDFEWCDDYSKVRNFAIRKVTSPWIFYADPDENYGVQQIGHFDKMIKIENAIAFIFIVLNYRGDRRAPSLSESVRLFRNLPEIKFTGLVHETLDLSITKYRQEHPKALLQFSPIPMYHWGFMKGKRDRAEKLAYYRKLNEKELKKNPKDCRPYYNLAMHFLEEQGNKEKGVKLLQESIKLNPGFYQPRRELGIFHLREARTQFMQGLSVLPKTHPFFNFQRKAVQWITNFLGEGPQPLGMKVKLPLPEDRETAPK